MTFTFNCTACGQDLYLDASVVHARTQKRIPLECKTGAIHDCPKKEKYIVECAHRCGAMVTFSSKMLSPRGKKIPLDVETMEIHNCPLNPFKNKK